MGEESLRHEVVSLDGLLNVGAVDTDSDSHDHVLWAFHDLAVHSKKVRSLESLETEVVVGKVPIVDDGRIENVLVVHDDLVDIVGNHGRVLAGLGVDPFVQIVHDGREGLLGLLVQVGDGDSGSEDSVVWVFGGEVRGGLGCQVVQLDGGDTWKSA